VRSFRYIFLLSTLVLANATLGWGQVIKPSGAWVTDLPDLLTPQEERSLSEALARYETESSTQIVVVIINSLKGEEVGDYATELGQQWGVGQKGQDNGIVLLVSASDRKMFIATGYGVEGSVTDAQAGRIVRNVLAPRFRNGQFYEGIRDASDQLVAATRGEFQGSGETSSSSRPRSSEGLSPIALIIIFLIIFFILSSLMSKGHDDNDPFDDDDDNDRKRRRRRQRRKRQRRRGWSGGGPVIIWGGGGGSSWGGGFSGGGSSGGFGGGGFGGFSGGGGGFGGGGAGGGW